MNKENAHEYLPLVQALAEGKTIQFKHAGGGWEDTVSVDFNYSAKYYRVKPEPRVFELIRSKRTGVTYSVEEWGSVMPTGKQADLWERITVQEVLK